MTKPDVVAPGVQVLSSIPPVRRGGGEYFYSYMDGTSMASPHVAGVAALLMAAHPKTPVTDIVQAIKETAAHPGGPENAPRQPLGLWRGPAGRGARCALVLTRSRPKNKQESVRGLVRQPEDQQRLCQPSGDAVTVTSGSG